MELAALAPMKVGESNSVGRSTAVLGFTSSPILVNFGVSGINYESWECSSYIKNGFGPTAFSNSAKCLIFATKYSEPELLKIWSILGVARANERTVSFAETASGIWITLRISRPEGALVARVVQEHPERWLLPEIMSDKNAPGRCADGTGLGKIVIDFFE